MDCKSDLLTLGEVKLSLVAYNLRWTLLVIRRVSWPRVLMKHPSTVHGLNCVLMVLQVKLQGEW